MSSFLLKEGEPHSSPFMLGKKNECPNYRSGRIPQDLRKIRRLDQSACHTIKVNKYEVKKNVIGWGREKGCVLTSAHFVLDPAWDKQCYHTQHWLLGASGKIQWMSLWGVE